MTAVTPTDRPKSVHNRCVIKVLVAFFMLSCCFLDFSVGAFVMELSQISSFLSFKVFNTVFVLIQCNQNSADKGES